MNEAETRAEHIDPALKSAGWGVVEGSKILREYPKIGFVQNPQCWERPRIKRLEAD